MIDYFTPRFNLKSMASIDTCQSGATCNVSSAARTLSSPAEEQPNGKQSFSGPISPGRKRRERPVIMAIIHPAVSLLRKRSHKAFSQRRITADETVNVDWLYKSNETDGIQIWLSCTYCSITSFVISYKPLEDWEFSLELSDLNVHMIDFPLAFVHFSYSKTALIQIALCVLHFSH